MSEVMQYWKQPGVLKGVSEVMGRRVAHWEDLDECAPEYVAVANPNKMLRYRRGQAESPASSVRPSDVWRHVQQHDGLVELFGSMWQREADDRPGYPARAILLWDVDMYGNGRPLKAVVDARLHALEPSYRAYAQTLWHHGIRPLTVMSGQGYHFFTQVPSSSPVMDRLIAVGHRIESTLAAKQSCVPPDTKRRKPVPPNTELAFQGAVRLQRFLRDGIMARIGEATISHTGGSGIAFDNTTGSRSVDTAVFGLLGSPYIVKRLAAEGIGRIDADPIIRLPRQGSGFELHLSEVLRARVDYMAAAELLADVDCVIPDGSQGIDRLIDAYLGSDHHSLDQALDASEGDDPAEFGRSYRQYERIIGDLPPEEQGRARKIIEHANPAALQPDQLGFLIPALYRAWGDRLEAAPHVAGFLRSLYEDPRYEWGHRFLRHDDALRRARFWVAEFLAQYLFVRGG